jgi:DNA replication and repair protein RecF
MILTKITLQNFRNYSKQIFSFLPETTLITGPNAVGKTNIIEAIFIAATGKSFRADSDKEMIKREEEVGRVTAYTAETKLETVLTTGLVSGQKAPVKKYLVNSVPRRAIDFIGNLHAVLFWPEDLELVTDSPSLRRKYLDRVLVQVDREYRRNLFSYEKGLRQRNRLLDAINEGVAARSQLLFWNQLLIKAGGYITDRREEYIDFINKHQLNTTNFHIIYDKSIISEVRLEQYKDEEVAAKATLVGPHRDDFLFQKSAVSDKSVKKNPDYISLAAYGSRGEQRLGVLWLKLGELAFIEEKAGDRPILLLDDIFSELDDEHRELVLSLIRGHQALITTAEKDVEPLLKLNKITFELLELPVGV